MPQKSISPGFLLFFFLGCLMVQLFYPVYGQAGLENTVGPQDIPAVQIPAPDQLSITGEIGEITDEPSPSLLWNLIISIIVLLVTGSTAALCLAAMRQWQGYWRAMAGAPVAVLMVWVAFIVLSIIARPDSHKLWPFEIFAWAMGTSVYMMLLMTAKKTFNKADAEKAEQAQKPSE